MFTVLLVGALAGWDVAGRKVEGTEGLVAQMQMLTGIAQTFVAFVAAVSTIAYVMLTSETLEEVRDEARNRRDGERRSAIDALIGSSLGAAAHAGVVAAGMKPDWRRRLPGWRRPHEQLLIPSFVTLTGSVTESLKAGEALSALDPTLRDASDEVVNAVRQAFENALLGDVQVAEAHAASVRAATDALRAAAQQG